jgi:surface polysaccharide O-acyltransferase-like enzyme
MEQTTAGRQLHMDILRIIAILFVLYNHTNERGYSLYAFPSSGILHIFYIVVAALIAVAVPIFFMISGASAAISFWHYGTE